MAPKLRLDRAGIAAVLRSAPVESAVSDLAEGVASRIHETAHDGPVPVETRSRVASGGRISARPAVDVILAHPGGLAIEAKYGALTKAASAAGLEVRGR